MISQPVKNIHKTIRWKIEKKYTPFEKRSRDKTYSGMGTIMKL